MNVVAALQVKESDIQRMLSSNGWMMAETFEGGQSDSSGMALSLPFSSYGRYVTSMPAALSEINI